MTYAHAFGTVVGGFFRQLGPLRTALIAGSLLVMIMAPSADVRVMYEGYGFVESVIMPSLAPLFLCGLLLDALMSKVLMNQFDDDTRLRLRLAMRTDLLVALLLTLAYAPFFLSLAA